MRKFERAEFLLDMAHLQLRSNELDAADADTTEAILLAEANGGGSEVAAGYLRRAQILSARGRPEQVLAVLAVATERGRPIEAFVTATARNRCWKR